MRRYAVLGQPVAHSKSPQIHQRFARQTGKDLSYEAIEVSPQEFESFVHGFFRDGGNGLNITLPHKEAAFALADSCAPRARLARAVNTLSVNDAGHIIGDNTDGAGLVRDLEQNLGVGLAGKALLILGAGGAARGAIPALLECQPGSLTVLNRTAEKALSIQAELAGEAPIQAAGYDDAAGGPFDVVINATSLSLSGQVPPIAPELLGAGCCCYDMMYGDRETAFMTWAKSHGAAVVADGLGMLVEQAAESFLVWEGIRPETQSVLAGLRH